MLERHIFLIGMPGSGKSSLGRKVAANLHLRYTDTDRRLAAIAGCTTTSETYERWGEEGFNNAETNLLIEMSREEPGLVSTGGGTVMNPQNREIMRSFGIIILVDRPLNQILGDIKLDDRRPMLMDKGLDEVERLYHERIDTYRESADIILDNSHGYYAGVSALEKLLRQRFRLN
ncbi:MAG: shikimate kinase [Clostridia bacterium]|nr:shikimate kinase [Clostridia bacterium]MBR4457571.1 shikimate kinase [Clostridia bacterium]